MPRPKATVFSVWMLSINVGVWAKRRVKGFHMIPNEPGEAWESLARKRKEGDPQCNRKTTT